MVRSWVPFPNRTTTAGYSSAKRTRGKYSTRRRACSPSLGLAYLMKLTLKHRKKLSTNGMSNKQSNLKYMDIHAVKNHSTHCGTSRRDYLFTQRHQNQNQCFVQVTIL